MPFRIRGFGDFDSVWLSVIPSEIEESLILSERREMLDFARHDKGESLSFRDNQVCLFVIPAITESEIEWRRIALLEQFLQPGLVTLFEQLNRAEVSTEHAQIPFVWVQVRHGNSGIVLHNSIAMFENEIADRSETVLEHQI